MKLDEAKEILNKSGYFLEDTDTSKTTKKQYWIEVQFSNDDTAYDAIYSLENFYRYNIQKQWNSYIDDVDYEIIGDGTVRVEGDDKDFLEYLIQFISETDMDSVEKTECSWK